MCNFEPVIVTLFFKIIYLFLAVLDLCCCAGFSLVAASGGYYPAAVCRLLFVVASHVAEHGLQGAQASAAAAQGLSSCASQTLECKLNSCGTQA